MSKKSYTPSSYSSYSINGQTKSSTHKIGNDVYANYNMNDYEKTLYDYAQKTLAESVPNINTFSPQVRNDMQKQLQAYQNQGVKSINDIYTPILNNLKNDMASRFGNLDNSMFMNNLQNIENNRSNAIATLAENLLSKQSNLINNELSQRYNFINLLNTLQNQYNNNALNSVATALSLNNSSLLNNNGGYSSPGIDMSAALSSMMALAQYL